MLLEPLHLKRPCGVSGKVTEWLTARVDDRRWFTSLKVALGDYLRVAFVIESLVFCRKTRE
jgi:hypothetical protein